MICQWERTMDEMLQVWAMTFDRSPQPFGIVEVLVDDDGRPYDAAYRYLNPAMAAVTDHTVEELTGALIDRKSVV